MSSLDAFSGARAGAASGLGGRKRGRPLGSLNKAKDPAATPPVPRRRGCYSLMAPENMLWRVVVVGADVLVRGE
jgi:hypothetical protein